MTVPSDHVSLATATGAIRVALQSHFASGLIALVAGTVAIVVAKGGRWHRKAGMVFVIAMTAAGVIGAGVAIYEGKLTSVMAGGLVTYFTLTAFAAVRPIVADRRIVVPLMLLGGAVCATDYTLGVMALGNAGAQIDGIPAGMILFMATIALCGVVGDWRLLRAGGIAGSRRIARHLWRMCFGLFIATGSFFLGQMKFIPKPLHIMPLLGLLAVAPLIVLLYWMWRVRIRQQLRGMTMTTVKA